MDSSFINSVSYHNFVKVSSLSLFWSDPPVRLAPTQQPGGFEAAEPDKVIMLSYYRAHYRLSLSLVSEVALLTKQDVITIQIR